uniref:Orf n=1 Tax=Acinetobacter baumannii TaxID=470 RepID=A0A0B4S3J0_ACIBA|nr:orf [Acinetobacter baumannii]
MTPMMRILMVNNLMTAIVVRFAPMMVMIDHHNLTTWPVETTEIKTRGDLNTHTPGKSSMDSITYYTIFRQPARRRPFGRRWHRVLIVLSNSVIRKTSTMTML